MKKVFVFFADGFEDIEALGTVDILRRGGIDVTTVSIMDDEHVVSAHGVTIIADTTFAEACVDGADMLVLPGGLPGSTNLRDYVPLQKLLVEFNEKGGLIAAICAAPSVLAKLGILEGKQATCYPTFKQFLGESYVGGLVVESKNIITAKGPGLSADFAFCIIEKLVGSEVADAVYEAAQY